ncbi:MAG: calcium-transporting P-type ATPase, PMR1-type [Patescibacteria group bacterium]|nr:MAG: calcium-transporting P-type ATPase, PMR1-type [Patescibacteria group bacterium]
MEQLGLTTYQVHKIQQIVGFNEIRTEQQFSPIRLFLSQFPSVINGILAIAALFSFIIGDTLDSIFILAIIILDSIFGFIQEYKAEKSLEKLRSYTSPEARVVRDGKEIQIPSKNLVPGDIVILSEGDRVPADGKLLETQHIELDESILTGESLPVNKEEGQEVNLGMLVTKGRGRMLVESIGMKTKFGQIAQTLTSIEAEKTPLQIQLTKLGRTLSFVAVCIAFLIVPLGLMQGKTLSPLLLLATSIAIAAVPVSLPAVITVALALGTSRMAKRKAIVRKMPSVETLGAVQIILVDKTGTLTENCMKVKKVWARSKESLPHIYQACVLGNTASLIQQAGGTFDIVGDKTDGALLVWAKNNYSTIDKIIAEGKVIDEFVFDAKTKMITTVWQKNGENFTFVRGAPETILERSKLSQQERHEMKKKYEDLAKEGLRIIAFATKTTGGNRMMKREDHEKDLTFLGFVGIYDPPRAEVKTAIAQARKAGIRTIMVTGDNELTALAIGKEIGLIENDEDVITGEELEKISDSDLLPILAKVRIFARTKPHDKLRITTLLQKQGFVVGVTGDGVNDALALKKADVGVAMGESGTDVAKEASDIVIADDNFATIVRAIEEGRTIYRNILKSITYLLTGNTSELFLVFFATLLELPSPLSPTQILWINLVTDGLPALALASDNKDPQALKQKPRNPNVPILTPKRMMLTISTGISLSIFFLLVFGYFYQGTTETVARTVTFNVLVFSHMALAFLVRGRLFLKPSKFLLVTVLATFILQIIVTTTPLFQKIFEIGF